MKRWISLSKSSVFNSWGHERKGKRGRIYFLVWKLEDEWREVFFKAIEFIKAHDDNCGASAGNLALQSSHSKDEAILTEAMRPVSKKSK